MYRACLFRRLRPGAVRQTRSKGTERAIEGHSGLAVVALEVAVVEVVEVGADRTLEPTPGRLDDGELLPERVPRTQPEMEAGEWSTSPSTRSRRWTFDGTTGAPTR